MNCNMGTCPSGQHITDFRQCGFAGCVDLRSWAKTHRYRYRLEESYQAESDQHVKGDGRWFVEILCQRGLIYPKGGSKVIAFTTSTDAWKSLLELGCKPHQVGDKERACKFPVELLDQVAAILKPRRRRKLDSDRARAISGLKTVHAQSGKTAQETTQGANERDYE
jgi:hypothetical protein